MFTFWLDVATAMTRAQTEWLRAYGAAARYRPRRSADGALDLVFDNGVWRLPAQLR